LLVAFGGLLRSTQAMLYGIPTGPVPADAPSAWPVAPVTLALLVLILTGVAWPPGLGDALEELAAIVGH
jgi:hypothetical protein